jgi:hypothetical protein
MGYAPGSQSPGSTPRKDPLPWLRDLHSLGYDYLLFLDSSVRSGPFGQERKWVKGRELQPVLYRDAEERFDRLYESSHAVLFSLPEDF